ncbi:hypothetical protein NL676_020916 [Syzygium grande]|nr:hypothetical protein NL676_020916 [Syzygium grande]
MHRLVLGNPFVALVAPFLLGVLTHKLLNRRRAKVRHQIGSFGKAFHYYGRRRFDPEVVEEWKQALAEVGSLKGWESERVANGHQAELVKMIVRTVLSKLTKRAVGCQC